MKKEDLNYICTSIANLTGIPVRIYLDGELLCYHSIVDLPGDPAGAYLDNIFAIPDRIGYFAADCFQYYGVVNDGGVRIVTGPVSESVPGDQELRELAFKADIPADFVRDFTSGMKAIRRMPLENLLQLLCALNFILTGERKSLRDVAIYDREQEALSARDLKTSAEKRFQSVEAPAPEVHNTYDLEQLLMNLIRKGDTATLREWLSSAPAVGGGTLSPNGLRQRKNIFIVTATLASRAAIRGGMLQGEAFTMSDAYIQKCELLESPERITNLQYHMILDFTEHVENLHRGGNATRLVIDVANYVRQHLSEPVTAEAIAAELFISRPYLSKKFREESGRTLTDFVLSEKTEEAKRLLRYTDKSLLSVSEYLGFSSQSHFIRVFKKYAGTSPREYRENHRE